MITKTFIAALFSILLTNAFALSPEEAHDILKAKLPEEKYGSPGLSIRADKIEIITHYGNVYHVVSIPIASLDREALAKVAVQPDKEGSDYLLMFRLRDHKKAIKHEIGDPVREVQYLDHYPLYFADDDDVKALAGAILALLPKL